jgi:hypothetical protein
VLKDHKVLKVIQVLKGQQELQVYLVMKVLKERWDFKVV